MPLLMTLETLFVLPKLLVERLLIVFVFVFVAFALTTLLNKRRSFGLSRFVHNRLAVLVKKMEGLLARFWVTIVPSSEIVL